VFSKRLALTLVATILAIAATDRFQRKLSKEQQAEHLLARLTFGARPGDVDRVKQVGIKNWVRQQLNPAGIEESAALREQLAALPTLGLSTSELVRRYPTPQILTAVAAGRMALPEDPELRQLYTRLSQRYKARIDRKKDGKQEQEQDQEGRREEGFLRKRLNAMTTTERSKLLANVAPQQAIANELTEGKIYRAVLSERQLEEVMTDFWFNHFNVYLEKGADRWLTTAYERDAIRPHVFGRFGELVKATAQHPAMLFYLDNWTSTAEQPRGRAAAGGRRRGINENYARELMELHTLGVDGGYTQKDVQEVARVFTGWSIENPREGAAFRFYPRAHDQGEKTVLGKRIAAGGMEEGLQVIELLSRHPSTARHIARKLAQRFVADEPPQALVDRMAATFTKTDGEIAAVLRTMIESPEFFSSGAYRSKMKSPLEMVAGALRATEAKITNALPLAQAIAGMGQPLYRKAEPTGYSNNGEDWLNSAGLLARMNFAVALSENKLAGVRIDATKYGAIAKAMGAPEAQRR
jgi:uncharacterized protein (DUF1800 family)